MGVAGMVAIFVSVYLLLLFPEFQNGVRKTAEEELSKFLDTNVKMENVSISPFNQVVLENVVINAKDGSQLIKVDKLGACLSLYNLAVRKRLVFTYAEVMGLDAKINKPTPDAQTNIQFIIDILSPKNKNNPPKKFDLSIYNIVLRKSKLSYDVLSEPVVEGRFDKNHISLANLKADIAIPRLRNNNFEINLKRVAFEEKSGFELSKLAVNTHICDSMISVKGFRAELPNSCIKLSDFRLKFNSLKTIGQEIKNIDLSINTTGSYITPCDLSAIAPVLQKLQEPIKLNAVVNGDMKSLSVRKFQILTDSEQIGVSINGQIDNVLDKDSLNVNLSKIYVKANSNEIVEIVSAVTKVSDNAKKIIKNCGSVRIDGTLKGSLSKVFYNGYVATSKGKLHLNGDFVNQKSLFGFKGEAKTKGFDVGALLGKQELLGMTAFDLDVNGVRKRGKLSAYLKGNVSYLELKGYRYHDILANLEVASNQFNGTLSINDENLALQLDGKALLDGENTHVDAVLDVNHCNLANINLSKKYPNHELSFKVNAFADGNQMNNLNGEVTVVDLKYVDENDEGIKLNSFLVSANNTKTPYEIVLASDVINGKLTGFYKFNTIIPAFKYIISNIFPALFDQNIAKAEAKDLMNDFNYSFKIEGNEKTNTILNFVKSPVTLVYPVSLKGRFNENANSFSLNVDAPYLAQKQKLIEGSSFYVGTDTCGELALNVKTTMPLKKGKLSLNVDGNGRNNRFDTGISWIVDREEDFHGDVNMSLRLGRVNETNNLMAIVDVNPTTLVFNDTAWHMHNSRIGVYNNNIRVNDFKVSCDKQFVKINGKTSANPEDELFVELQDINLDYIFETLQINNVTFGGRATGKIRASELLTKNPRLETESFFVDDMSYNQTLLGDADIKSYWNNDDKFVSIKADISQPNGCNSKVDGGIYVTRDSMSFDFDAEKLKVGFLKPFMSAFTSDIDGYASGFVQLYGRFSSLNLRGDVFAEDLKIKLDYTNVYYSATDSVKIIPNLISFENIQLKDRNGKTAKLSGYVAHEDFHNASFMFNVTDAVDLLCYDIPEKVRDPWWGTIYGTGGVNVIGDPGIVSIDVDMAIASGSKFYYELTDEAIALEYDFVTFTDKKKEEEERLRREQEDEAERILKRLVEQQQKTEIASSSKFSISIDAEISPAGQLILIMDPAGGDHVKATGNGTLTMNYDSSGDLFMNGKYVIDKGTYNFTLQDIIVKDFIIKEGSSISFNGDPMKETSIDLSAKYPLNANLLDLDESFATDKEFNRTNVTVNALLNVTGNIASPAISFDLEFPTLSSDAYRKVKSIVSTDDMMNRQIIYLLALNRFYTPEYMGGTNRKNELTSVASSTISSQLTSLLGQISDTWRISPNFKSDKGDFSDVEVNLALSSQLLNNRLLLNGNFGYRDDKMSSSSNSNFIGDFDIEYLLNKAGNIRLKAYNHFNDQNYYVKNALTTQGVGVLFKYDFDKAFEFMRKKNKAKLELKNDTQPVVKDDSNKEVINNKN